MNQYCVVVCGLQAGTSDEASAWAPVAAALRMEPDEFASRVLAALPRIVRRQLDQATATRIAQLLQGMHVDARALPDDAQLAYIDRDGRSCGPLPQPSLHIFIAPGERYRMQGNHAWETWPAAHEPIATPPPAIDEVAAPGAELPVEAPADHAEAEAEVPSAEATSPIGPPSLPSEPSPPAISTPGLDDEGTTDDALINPPQEEEQDPAPAAEEPADAGTDQPRRSRSGRLLVALVVVGLAAWAWWHWMADSRVDDTPPPAAVARASQPALPATTAPATSTSAPAAAVSTATGASPAPADSASVPAPGGTAALPAATSTAAPAAPASAAPAQPSSVMPATAASAPAHAGSAVATPAPASSSPQG